MHRCRVVLPLLGAALLPAPPRPDPQALVEARAVLTAEQRAAAIAAFLSSLDASQRARLAERGFLAHGPHHHRRGGPR